MRWCFFLSLIFIWLTSAWADVSDSSFAATWKLLDGASRQQFVAGYLQAWADAAKVNEVAVDYIKENPVKAVDGLQSIKGLYDFSEISPGRLVDALNAFYSDPSNQSAGLAKAVTAIKGQLVKR